MITDHERISNSGPHELVRDLKQHVPAQRWSSQGLWTLILPQKRPAPLQFQPSQCPNFLCSLIHWCVSGNKFQLVPGWVKIESLSKQDIANDYYKIYAEIKGNLSYLVATWSTLLVSILNWKSFFFNFNFFILHWITSLRQIYWLI